VVLKKKTCQKVNKKGRLIQEARNSMNFAEVKIKQNKFFIKIRFISLGNKILRLSRIKPPKNLTPAEEFSLK